MKIVQIESIYPEAFQLLGHECDLSEELYEKKMETFPCVLYDQIKCRKMTVNELRYKLV